MAETRSMTTRFGSNTTGLKQGVSEVVEQLKKLNKELVDNQYKQKDCNKAISDAKKELNKLNQETKNGENANAEQKKRIEELNKTIEEEKLKLSQLRTEQTSLKQVISETSKSVVDNNKEWTVLKATLANLASDTLQMLARKLVQVGQTVLQVGQQFSASMSEVAAISGASAEDLERLEQTAREYGATTKFSASESAQALKYMALAGWDANQSIDALGSVLDLAAAGGMDLARASDIVTDYITAFGLSAQDSAHFADVMAYAMAHSNTNVEQLGEAYKNCASTAASMGYSLEEVTAVLMTMANAGVKGGEAGTTLNAIMTRLATDTKGCATELHNMGIEIYDDNDNLKSLSEILTLVAGAFEGLSDKSDATLAKIIAGQNQYAGFQTILKGLSGSAEASGQSFMDYAEALNNADGASKGMAKTMSDNLSGDLKTMQSAFEELALKIYEDGEQPVRSLVQTITKQGVPALELVFKQLDKIAAIVVSAGSAILAYKIYTVGATIAQQGFSAALAATPMGAFAVVLGGLAGAMAMILSSTNDNTNATKELNEETENYLATLNQIESKQKQRLTDAETEHQTLKKLVQRYDELRNSVSLTEDKKRELDTIAADLAKTMGKSVDDLKDKDGAYKDLTQDIDKYIEKLKKQIQYETSKEGLTEAYKAYNQAKGKTIEYNKRIKEQQEHINDLEIYYHEESLRLAKKMQTDLSGTNYKGMIKDLAIERDKILKEEQKKLDSLTGAWADYYNQASNAAVAVRDYSVELGSSSGAAEEFEKNMEALNGTVSETGNKTTEAGKAVDDLSGSLETAAKSADDLDKAMTDSLSNASDTLSMIDKIKKEVSDSGKISLSTLNSIIKKYPELTDKVYEYIGGLTDEKSVLEGLDKAYRTDVDNYNTALGQKKLLQNGFLKTAAENNAELINKYKDQYNIDLQNFTTVEAAKIAAKKQLQEQYEKSMANLRDKYEVIGHYQGQEIVYNKEAGRLATNEETQAYFKARQEAENSYFDFDGDEFAKQLAEDVGKAVSNITADGMMKLAGSSGSSGGSTASSKSSDTSTITVSGRGVSGSGKTAVAARLQWLERLSALGKTTEKEQAEYLQRWLNTLSMSDDEAYQLEKKLYDLKKKLAETEEKEKEERLKAQQQKEKEQYDIALAALKNLTDARIEQQKKLTQIAEENADKRIAAIDREIKKRNEQAEDDKRKAELDKISARLKYEQLEELDRYELEKRKQQIIDEQADVDYQRQQEADKEKIRSGTAVLTTRYNANISGLQANYDNLINRIAALAGTQTAAQKIVNNNQQQNFNIINNALSSDQIARKIAREIYNG